MKKAWLSLFIGISFIIVLAGCNSDPKGTSSEAKSATSGSADKVKIGFQKGNTLHILKSLGYLEEKLKKDNISIEWVELATGGALLEALNTNNIDFGHAADANAVFAQAAGMPLVYIASEHPNPEGLAIIVHGDSDIKTAADLKGKKISIGKGWNSHYLLMKALQKEGLTSEDVDFAYVKDASEGRAAFESERVDALGFWDPFLAVLENDISPRILLDGEGFTNNRTYYFASDSFSKENSEVIKTILEELDKADQWANENKSDLAKMLADSLGIPLEAIEKTVERRTYGVEKITESVVAEQQDIADIFLQEKLIEAEISVSDMVTEDPAWFPDTLE
ncbi:aliphatic sulfonate ABC transporter substrate-binding protein [Lederbergia lenta]|uniref:Putative aliphatic sulfonates-binding protein n=1 Tax=Lederbergia lenta TaxID=1467 RepID=A0A2X4ZT50_LEDLE|nr:aliphatic sulfonate ABC transporter substrate-binding protein [Lederbergia lenta]MCM3112932.1 aliphatic sulfonate ABC transporter substrate-binding protein [Lederbergia lenta]MEC2326101.1 aliphatic sulfonate ABC transporter substrate-binding protein [Lederbergia lenta]SQI63464.1 nitrate/sulfonate/bicarbonate ABC transporter substrate-binding protein [Lederbergia lenta]